MKIDIIQYIDEYKTDSNKLNMHIKLISDDSEMYMRENFTKEFLLSIIERFSDDLVGNIKDGSEEFKILNWNILE